MYSIYLIRCECECVWAFIHMAFMFATFLCFCDKMFVYMCVCLGVGFTILKSFILELQLCKCVKRWRWRE